MHHDDVIGDVIPGSMQDVAQSFNASFSLVYYRRDTAKRGVRAQAMDETGIGPVVRRPFEWWARAAAMRLLRTKRIR